MAILPPLSESVQMYLVAIVRLREKDEEGVPVPLSDLARELSVSPVSVNEMCRKLQDQGLLVYQPYKGVSLSAEGERRALYVLRRHRMWEVFLVERLGLCYSEAHEAACHLEHSTPDGVVDSLEAYLEHPQVNPLGEPIPTPDGVMPPQRHRTLSELLPGHRGHVIRCEGSEAACAFLRERGLKPGAWVSMVALADSGLLVRVEGTENELALSGDLAERIRVAPEDGEG